MAANIEMISPIMLIAEEHAHSRYYSEDVYKMASGPKELVIVPNADHVDLYDRTEVIPFDKLTSFFNEHLKMAKADQAEKAKGNGSANE